MILSFETPYYTIPYDDSAGQSGSSTLMRFGLSVWSQRMIPKTCIYIYIQIFIIYIYIFLRLYIYIRRYVFVCIYIYISISLTRMIFYIIYIVKYITKSNDTLMLGGGSNWMISYIYTQFADSLIWGLFGWPIINIMSIYIYKRVFVLLYNEFFWRHTPSVTRYFSYILTKSKKTLMLGGF